MSGCNKSPKSDKPSIKYRSKQYRGSSIEADISCVDYKPCLSNNESKKSYRSSELKSHEILSTPQLISAIGRIWDSASRPLSFFLPEAKVNEDDQGFQKDKIFDIIDEKRNVRTFIFDNTNYFPISSSIVQEKLDFPKVTQKMSAIKSFSDSEDYVHFLFQRFGNVGGNNSNKNRKDVQIGSGEITFRSGNVYWWMSRNAAKGLADHLKVTEPENTKTQSPVDEECVSVDTITPAVDDKSDECNAEGLPLSNDAIPETRKVSPLCSDYFLQAVPDTKADIDYCQTLSSSIYADYHINYIDTCNSASTLCQHKIDNNELLEVQKKHFLDVTDEEPKVQIFSATPQKPQFPLAKQEHAFSGALAGVCVSLCLHPVDTVKTVIQSCRAEQRSIFYIGKSIVSDRGFSGLYRGITSNIASSAPISAVYTFTYESVKAALVPYLPKEYYSFAHCVGGGCASVATSFIFTPSERIKQQMQVGSHYRNCWDALVGILRNGGFPSLYAGWGAVLCRNVPHSIIKFYTYESLKQVMPSSIQHNTFQTLVCGGIAGSTAALCTTPFDVIKTRLQTQVPGSRNQYDSVFHALYKISKSEGLKGLYRGLTPRLIMYMSQGSMFFASYEFFKRIFSLEEGVSQHNGKVAAS
ncbi:PREDICTED: probable S-adenosylmethionine carrier 2, chloroplastic [Lupinus angustifolius]|uniref:probable S-adenosylmethionine carrier 2, chloroplastic n=1 Tax=Lupinus angustifolius TaxID=3871 RepID=UPI00092F4E0F|nr:PREDICTED: probable S-adenosylmethionine carrier 2, chloroplastic [Lupinus angustifolius]